MEKILITGGGGFVGGYVYRHLQSLGFETYNFDLAGQRDRYHICASILDYGAVKKAVDGVDIVFHFAGFSNINLVKDNPKKCIDLNIMGTTNFLEAIRLKGSGKFVFASSVYVHNQNGHFYTTSKFASERICENYNRLYGLPIAVLRLGTVYGEQSRHEDVVSIFARRAVAGQPLVIHGSGNQLRHFIHGEDIAKFCGKLLSSGDVNGTFILSARCGVSIKELAEITSKYCDNLIIKKLESTEREDDYRGDLGDGLMFENTCEKFQWEPSISIDVGVKRLTDYFRKKLFS